MNWIVAVLIYSFATEGLVESATTTSSSEIYRCYDGKTTRGCKQSNNRSSPIDGCYYDGQSGTYKTCASICDGITLAQLSDLRRCESYCPGYFSKNCSPATSTSETTTERNVLQSTGTSADDHISWKTVVPIVLVLVAIPAIIGVVYCCRIRKSKRRSKSQDPSDDDNNANNRLLSEQPNRSENDLDPDADPEVETSEDPNKTKQTYVVARKPDALVTQPTAENDEEGRNAIENQDQPGDQNTVSNQDQPGGQGTVSNQEQPGGQNTVSNQDTLRNNVTQN